MINKFINATNFAQKISKVATLFKNIWKENTTALIQAPREVDKAGLALKIAADVAATGREVLYVDTERHAGDHIDLLKDAQNMSIFVPTYESPEDRTDYADLVIAGIEEAIATTSIRVFVIDSVTRIAALSFGKNASAAYVMKRLVALQVRCGISLLVIAHETTKSVGRALRNLADCEISVEEESATTPVSKAEPKSELAAPAAEIPVKPSPLPMSRRQRRALEREQRKLARRAAKSSVQKV